MLSKLRKSLSGLRPSLKRALLMVLDAVALLAVLWVSFSLRLGGDFTPTRNQWLLMLLAPVLALPIYYWSGLYRAVIRYLPERAIWTILKATSLATMAWVLALFYAEATRIAVLPRSVPVFYFVFSSIVIGGSRFFAKYFLLPKARNGAPRGDMLIYGAGAAGTQLADALRGQTEGRIYGFIDDDKSLHDRDVLGYRVYPPERIGQLIEERGIKEVVLSIPSADAARRQQIFASLSRYPLKIRALPAIADLASGKYLVNQLREIDIDDLLGRSTVPADPTLFSEILEGRVILVTGAGGSIGSELCRQIVKWKPKKLVLFEANEFALYEIERQLAARTEVKLVPVLGSVEDGRLAQRTFVTHGIEVVFHAAAHKHVPLLEANVLEGVRNNVLGTKTLAEAAYQSGVERFVLISTDKAVRPSNVMGATKRWAELIIRHYGKKADPARQRFSAVRFGNVLGSNGSVVPLFREQIAAGGPVTLTDARMTRYFMSIHEAAELIVQAGALSEGGDIFLLEMGEPVGIRDLAENMIRLAGLSVRSEARPDGDIAIVETGMRPGEKLTEELFYDPAGAQPTRQPKILRSAFGSDNDRDIDAAIAELTAALDCEDEPAVRQLLFALVER